MTAEVQWLQKNDLTRLDYDARYRIKIYLGIVNSGKCQVLQHLSSANLHAKATLPVNLTLHQRPLLISLNKILKELDHKVKPILYGNHARRF